MPGEMAPPFESFTHSDLIRARVGDRSSATFRTKAVTGVAVPAQTQRTVFASVRENTLRGRLVELNEFG